MGVGAMPRRIAPGQGDSSDCRQAELIVQTAQREFEDPKKQALPDEPVSYPADVPSGDSRLINLLSCRPAEFHR